jgi:hypothetical protein
MNNPFKSDRAAREHDNPVVPNVIERPIERAAARPDGRDNPLVPDAIERPVERAAADARSRSADGETRQTDERRPMDERRSMDETHQMELFPHDELAGYRNGWESIQAGFVDEPRAAVERADKLVSQVMNRLTEVFSRERSMLEGQWTKGDDVSTEDLRVAFTRYRSFFNRLLSM